MNALPSIWVTQVGILARESNSILVEAFWVIFALQQRTIPMSQSVNQTYVSSEEGSRLSLVIK